MLSRLRKMRPNKTDQIRQGTGSLDNFVVLVASLALLAAVGLGLLAYWS